jgi:hypothetical protein
MILGIIIVLEMRLRILFKVFVVLLNLLHGNASFSQSYRSWRCDIFFVVTVQSMWSFCIRDFVSLANGIRGFCYKDSLTRSFKDRLVALRCRSIGFGDDQNQVSCFSRAFWKEQCWRQFSVQQPGRWLPQKSEISLLTNLFFQPSILCPAKPSRRQ